MRENRLEPDSSQKVVANDTDARPLNRSLESARQGESPDLRRNSGGGPNNCPQPGSKADLERLRVEGYPVESYTGVRYRTHFRKISEQVKVRLRDRMDARLAAWEAQSRRGRKPSISDDDVDEAIAHVVTAFGTSNRP